METPRCRAVFLSLAIALASARAVDDFDEELYSVIDAYRDGSLWAHARRPRSVDPYATNPTRNDSLSDNSLWNDLWQQCRRKPSFSCVKSGVFKYLDKSLTGAGDFEVTDQLAFRRNGNKPAEECENSEDARETCRRYGEAKRKLDNPDADEGTNATTTGKDDDDDVDDDITEGAADGRSVDTLGDVSDILYEKGAQFMMTHDVELQLPEMFFGGGSIRIEPKTFVDDDDDDDDGGTLVKIVFKPPPPPPASKQVVRGRLLHHLKRLFKKKLMHSFMALMLIIKMIKVKIMFLLPMIVGQSTAKKLLLKVLLFLIPGLAHLFKLCHYYHMEHAKYHHHHHKIKHHHHTVKVPVPVPVPVHHHHHGQQQDEGHYPAGYDYPVPYPPFPPANDHEYEYQGSNHDNSVYKDYGQYTDNEAALASWGLGSHNYRDAGVLDAKDQPSYSEYSDPSSYYKKAPYGYPDGSYYQNDVSSHKQFYGSKLQFLSHKPAAATTLGSSIHRVPDPFYTPILQRIDSIFAQMGYNDEGCRERLVCSMYKSPHRFSPHSNLLSNELSRDATELQKPVANNEDVLRFYRYVQAARDGQDQKDCLLMYHACHVNTER